MANWTEIFGESLVTKTGEKPTGEVLSGKEYVLVYFSAHWCPPCRGFTPELAAWYNNGGSAKAEIVFASSDQDQASFDEYYDEARGDIDSSNVTFWDAAELKAKAEKKAEKKAEIMKRGETLWDMAFALMDKNGNGVLEKDEVGAVLKQILPDMVPPGAPIDEIMAQQLDAIMEQASSSGSGTISKEEGWKFMTEEVFAGVEEQPSGRVDQLIGTIEAFIQEKL